ncbi:MAG: hypothetical protein VX240_01865 [Actinomycetota bacterium]|nr:hypothetical protein [Actinomycetota bacterium]
MQLGNRQQAEQRVDPLRQIASLGVVPPPVCRPDLVYRIGVIGRRLEQALGREQRHLGVVGDRRLVFVVRREVPDPLQAEGGLDLRPAHELDAGPEGITDRSP